MYRVGYESTFSPDGSHLFISYINQENTADTWKGRVAVLYRE